MAPSMYVVSQARKALPMLCLVVLLSRQAGAQTTPSQQLAKALVFHASFDATVDADFARGDRRLYTAPSGKRDQAQPGNARKDVTLAPGKGRHGGCLRFADNSKQVLFYQAKDNLPYSQQDWSGTVGFWLRLDPDQDLKPGYCDPVQITDKKWNDASFFVDFTKDDVPRKFRLGVFANYKFWNPKDIKWEQFPAEERPMVTVDKTPFGRDRWTHVLFTFSGINREGEAATAALYLDGKLQGTVRRPQQFTWETSKAAIMLGLSYIGDFDDLAVFDRALTQAEVQQLYGLKGGVKDLRK